ncbi:hypothetical protein D917_04999 [Trichinella nativa]|uniref:Uncharacterized protein n=1 Tax=Trichinella nativa TaxID=6335 RepID=A0A1Y3F3J3_9BILA|nr:hypothetical protein D917_04999 [Trichinella nativa]
MDLSFWHCGYNIHWRYAIVTQVQLLGNLWQPTKVKLNEKYFQS